MLMTSPRHSEDDLRLWREFEESDLVHASSIKHKSEMALKTIRDFAHSPCYVSVSWGKDSIVLAHLAAISGYEIPLVWIRVEPIKNPDCLDVRDAFLSVWDCEYKEIEIHCAKSSQGWSAKGTLESGIRECHKRFGKRALLGIRAEESGSRRISCFANGTDTKFKCRPLAFWTAQDVFSYLALHQLPVHAAYGCLGGGFYDRERIRVSSLSGKRGRGNGRHDWERQYYGDEMRRLGLA